MGNARLLEVFEERTDVGAIIHYALVLIVNFKHPTDAHKGLSYYTTLSYVPHAVYSKVAPCGRPYVSIIYLNNINLAISLSTTIPHFITT